MKGLRQSNKGFTLVELCVVLVLISILATTTTMSLISWQEYSQENKQYENAELIYMAARNKISILKANGVLENFNGWAKDPTCNISGKKYYAVCKKGQYKDYSKTNPISGNGTQLLFSLVAEYVYDKTILDANIAIEYLADGTICDIFYSDRSEEFKYGSGTTGTINLLNTENRKDDFLQNNMIGHYSTE